MEETAVGNLFFRGELCRGSGPININKMMSGTQIRPRKTSSVSHAASVSRQQHPSPLQIVEWDVKQLINIRQVFPNPRVTVPLWSVEATAMIENHMEFYVWNPDRAT